MKIVSSIVLLVLGVYLIYEGMTILTFEARSPGGGMGITKLIWLFIPITDFHLLTYGTVFIAVGVLLLVASYLLLRFALKRKR